MRSNQFVRENLLRVMTVFMNSDYMSESRVASYGGLLLFKLPRDWELSGTTSSGHLAEVNSSVFSTQGEGVAHKYTKVSCPQYCEAQPIRVEKLKWDKQE